jgi:hypothetical protein
MLAAPRPAADEPKTDRLIGSHWRSWQAVLDGNGDIFRYQNDQPARRLSILVPRATSVLLL